MKADNLFDKILRFFVPKRQTTRILILTRNGKWTPVNVDCPVSFSELDRVFGEGNWKL